MDDERYACTQYPEVAEAELRNLCGFLSNIAQNVDLERFSEALILFVQAETGRITDANAIACELLGYSSTEIREKLITDIEVAPQSGEQAIRRYVETAIEMDVYECLYRQGDGGTFPVRVRRQAITRDGNSLIHYLIEDRSIRHYVWKELIRREDRDFAFRERMKALNEVNTSLGTAETLDDLCRNAVLLGKERLGFDRLGLWLFDTQSALMKGTYGVDEHGELRDEHHSSWGISDSLIVDFTTGHKTPIISTDVAPIYDSQSHIIGYGWHLSAPMHHEDQFIGYVSADNFLSGQPMRNYQPELLRSYAAAVGQYCAHHLARESAKRLAEDMRSQEKRIQMLGTFISHIGHDFRTPLTVINTSAYLLSRSNDPARKAELAARIEGQVDYINRVVHEMLTAVSLEEPSEFSFQWTSLRALINSAVESVTNLATEKGLRWTYEVPPPTVLAADQVQLERAIREILHNAIIFTNAGGHITVSTEVDEKHITIRVNDTGIGIAAGEQEKIFQHLYRVDQARTTQGVGLGLTLAKRIVEAHGGFIRVASTPDVGSTFEIVLPLEADIGPNATYKGNQK